MSRPEKPIDPSSGPVPAFAVELRAARSRAGLTYRQMAGRGFVSQSTLSKTASGEGAPPTWEAVEAYLRSLGLTSELSFWRDAWAAMRNAYAERVGQRSPQPESNAPVGQRHDRPVPAKPLPPRRRAAGPDPRPHRPRALLAVTFSAILIAAAGIATIRLTGVPPESRQWRARANQDGFNLQVGGKVATVVLVAVQNMTVTGAAGLVEDATPAYLSSRPVPDCARHGCKVDGTQMWSGATLAVMCTIEGALVTNYQSATDARHNPDGVASSLWYRGVMAENRSGYLSEARVAPRYRGGLGLPSCDRRPAPSSPTPSEVLSAARLRG